MIRINLAPVIDPWPGRSRPRLGIVIGLAGFVLLGALVAWFWALKQDEKRLTQAVAHAGQELATLREVLRPSAGLREDLADLTKRAQSIEALLYRRGATLHILDAFLDAIPHGLWITTLEGRGRELRALGAALSAGGVADLLSSLRASGRFDDVDIIVAQQDLGEVPRAPLLFEITCRFGG